MAPPNYSTITETHSVNSDELCTLQEKHDHFQRASRRLITVEPILILINLVQGALVTLRYQYIEHRLADQNNYTLPTGKNSCASQDETDRNIEDQTSLWVTGMKDMSVFPPIVVALVLGAASDFVGRRPMFIINASGHFLGSVLFLCVAIFKLPLPLLIVGELMLGLAGDAVFTAIIAEAYVADIYSGKARTYRLVIIDAVILFSFGIIQFGIDEILQNTGINFILVYGITVGLALLNLLYTITPCLLLETVKRRPFPRGVLKELALNILSLFGRSHAGRRWRLSLCLAIACLWTLIFEAVGGNIIIYGLSPPFCWSPEIVGAYGAIINALPAVVSIVAVPVLRLCMSTFWMVYIGFASGIGYMIATALSPTNIWLAYIAPTIGMFLLVPLPIAKTKCSEQVGENEQGAVFGCLAVVISLARFISPILLNGILATELKKPKGQRHPNVTYYAAAGILLLPIMINAFLHITQPKVNDYKRLEDSTVCPEERGYDACCDEKDLLNKRN
ncbi:proton-coupled folate transporter-like [Patiria miniata]|uniref:Proton-coupled folate transporter n=1 Tax=Patiria miniata TaxID=46514 RepID=A0A914A2U5_PATMI|nr:proton-coupled folate transporter-like [Patiria miniata]